MGTNRLAKYGEAPQLDGLGSMRQGVNMNNGVFTGQADYSAFGEYIGGNNIGAFQSVYQWGAESGYRMDGSSGGGGDCGLVKVGTRYYDPAVGRFTSRDSDMGQELLTIPALAQVADVLAFLPKMGHNAYACCNGDPINYTDPTGHQTVKSVTTGLAAATMGAIVGGVVSKRFGAEAGKWAGIGTAAAVGYAVVYWPKIRSAFGNYMQQIGQENRLRAKIGAPGIGDW